MRELSLLPGLLLLLLLGACNTPRPSLSEQGIFLRQHTYGLYAEYIPPQPKKILVLIHGYPWPDNSRSEKQLTRTITLYIQQWKPFAEKHNYILLAPAFGSGNFAGYRRLFGRQIDADEFVNMLVEQTAKHHLTDFGGQFSLYGHSAGGQFASRYLVAHPQHLEKVILSAPGTYPFPNPEVSYPYGMKSSIRTARYSGTTATGKAPNKAEGATYTPDKEKWIQAATEVPVFVLVGSKDTKDRDPEPGQRGANRLERAENWVSAMNELAREHHRQENKIRLFVVEGADHDPEALQPKAWSLLEGNP